MIEQLKTLKSNIEHDTEFPLTPDEVAFLESIQTVNDLHRPYQSNTSIQALAFDAALALGTTTIEAQMITGEADPDSMTKISVFYHDGEYLSGYMLHGNEALLLEKIGLAHYVDGWGYHANDKAVQTLGTEFYYHQAIAYAKPALDKVAQEKQLATEARQAIFALAARTGQPAILDEYDAECNDRRHECSLDIVTIYAMPNGTTKTVRSHTC